MLRRVVITAVLAGVFAAPAAAYSETLMPGVTYTRQVAFTPHGAVAIHVITAPKPGGLWRLSPVLSDAAIIGRARLTDMEKAASASATVAGVNGDAFDAADGHPSGLLIRDGVLEHPPLANRSSVGIGGDGGLTIARVAFSGFWQGIGQRRPLIALNEARTEGVSLFTPVWGPATPAAPGAVEAVVSPFPAVAPGVDVAGKVVAIARDGNTPIPAGGAVFQARGGAARSIAAEAQVGQRMAARLTLNPAWSGITDALGGGPALVRRGRPVFRAFEDFLPAQLAPRTARTAVGQKKDGTVLLVVVDGRQPGYSVGMTNFELAQTLVRLGAVTASALDSGDSSTMAFDGALLNRPSDPGGERLIGDALLVEYLGVYAPPPAAEVLSPNGDGVDETQSLAYKLVRPSTVTATLVGPDGAARYSEEGVRPAGTYKIPWTGTEPEGRWRWTISAVDDLGRRSSAERVFWLNNTLGFLRVPATSVVRSARRFVVAQFKLAHPARVTVDVETRSGVLVKTVLRARLGVGDHSVVWSGRNRKRQLVFGGRYVVDVSTSNELGPAELSGQLILRR